MRRVKECESKNAMTTFGSPCYLVTGPPLISSIFWRALSFNSLALSESAHVARGRTLDAPRVTDLEEEGAPKTRSSVRRLPTPPAKQASTTDRSEYEQ
jgi:hypothetical protein